MCAPLIQSDSNSSKLKNKRMMPSLLMNEFKSNETSNPELTDYDSLSSSTLNNVLDQVLMTCHGYTKIKKLYDTGQGSIYEAINNTNNNRVCIKRVSKLLHKARESIEDGMRVIVDKDIIRECEILKYLTNHGNVDDDSEKKKIPNYFAKYVDFFESPQDYYLVTEYVGDLTLSSFISRCHDYISQNKLKLGHYKKIVKFLFFQLIAVITWMHQEMNVCHLDLSPQHIILCDDVFEINDDDGTVKINSDIYLKIIDFGLSQRSKSDPDDIFECDVWGLKNSFQCIAPNVYKEEVYDAKKADIWSLGIILYKMSTNEYLYNLPTKKDEIFKLCFKQKKLQSYINLNNLQQFINKKMLNLLNGILKIKQHKRYSTTQILKSEYLKSYFNAYSHKKK